MEKSPIYTIFAGVNGAGKSTLYKFKNKENYGVRINTDEIVGQEWRNQELQLKAGREAIKIREKAFNENKSLNQETTLTGNGILKAIDKAKELGYKINVYYIGVESPEIAKERVNKRVLLGEHGIPEKTIEKRYYESLENLKKIRNKCDKLQIYDNSKIFKVIVEIKKDKLKILDKDIPKWVKKSLSLEIEEKKKERNPWSKKKNNDRGMER
ncbi:zeta toxin family protein [Cetobacterium sp.]|uniref:zeta toxin family protein n=1 Tax=Cetobacterium sp. TaxID=2071632 RepID=UPI0025C46841|nr:zeta toxin family protein [Cetobacterium sp.]